VGFPRSGELSGDLQEDVPRGALKST
jgi:hypothetical protein